jgi:quercetin dioxygenase-like cupin family protein
MPYFDIDAFKAVVDPIAGVERRFIHTESITLAVISFKAGARVPRHAHPNEQLSLVASGLFELTIGEETQRLPPGGCGLIPENISHAARAVEDCVVIEVFSPKRENFG